MLNDDELRQRLAGQQWTAHSVRLSAAVETRPGQPGLIETDTRLHAIVRLLRIAYHGKLAGLRVADLGCLEGGFSLAFARHGCRVLGLEARRANFEKAQLLKEHFAHENLEFRLADVKDFTSQAFGRFDVVLALGILYHLDDPVAWLKQIGAATTGVLVVESHYAPEDGADLTTLKPGIAGLSPIEQKDAGGWTAEGRWFFEYDKDIDRESQLWASYSNSTSFWLTKPSLLQALKRAGFDVIVEQFDYTADHYRYFTREFSRGLFVALKTSAFDPR